MAGIAPPPMGLQEVFGIAREASYGATTAPTIWWKPLSNTIQRVDPHLPMAGASGAMVRHLYNATRPRKYQGTPAVAGNVVVEGEYDDIGQLFSNILGAPASDDDAPEVGAHTHVWSLTAAKPANMPTSCSAARLNGLEDYRFLGGLIDNFEMRGAPGAIVTVSADWIFQAGGDTEVADADTEGYSAAPWMEFHDTEIRYHATPNTATAGLATLASGSEVDEWTFRLENRLRSVQAAGNGIRGIREPVWNDYRMATISFPRDFFDDDFFDEYMSSTVTAAYSTVEVKLQTTTLIGATATPYECRIYMPFAVLDRTNTYGGGAAPLKETVTFEAGTDGSVAPLTITLINGTDPTPSNPYSA